MSPSPSGSPHAYALRASLRLEAGRVWREKGDAERIGLQLNEETITETLLFRLAKRHRHSGLRVRAFSKPEEKKSGSDWEWWFVQGGSGVGLRVQAKRIFPSGTFKSLKAVQTTQLITKAGNCHPFFVFYNDEDSVKTGIGSASRLTGVLLRRL
jgi:hypothetical protein